MALIIRSLVTEPAISIIYQLCEWGHLQEGTSFTSSQPAFSAFAYRAWSDGSECPPRKGGIHSFILAISIAPLQVLYYSEALPATARILCRSFTPKRTGNCR